MIITAQSTDAIVADAYFPALRDHIISATGLVFYADRPQALAGHLADRLKKRELDGCFAYWELLQDEHAGEGELDQLIALLTIGETHFFRHREVYDALREVALPEIIDRHRTTRRLRVWSAGCSTGPEAYSVSILLRRDLRYSTQDWNISILGTDINRPFLAQAAEGCYEEWAFRGTAPELRRECFVPQAKSWRIAPCFQDGVSFQYHNLVRHPFPSLVHNLLAFDLILCRNVLIYFAPEIVDRVISQLADCLVPGGWLAVGHAEHGANLLGQFDAVNFRGATLYRKPELPTERMAFDRPRQPSGAVIQSSSPSGAACSESPPQKRTDWSGRPPTFANVRPKLVAQESRGLAVTPCLEVGQIRTLADQGHVDAALQLCETLLAGQPLNPKYYFYQALLLDQVAGHDAALVALNKAIYLDREFDLAHYYLGLTQQKLGNAPGACKSFRNALRLLAGRDRTEHLPDAEGLTIADLTELTQMHLEMLEAT